MISDWEDSRFFTLPRLTYKDILMKLIHMKKIAKYKHKITLAFLIGFIITLVFIFLGDYQKIRNGIFAFNYIFVIPVLLLSLINFFLRHIRFRYYLSVIGAEQKLTYRDTLMIFFAGLSMTVTPGKAGEAIKTYFIQKKTGIPISKTLPILFIERFTDALSALFLMSGGLLIYRFGFAFFLISVFTSIMLIFILQQKNLCISIIHLFRFIPVFSKYIASITKFYESSYTLIKWPYILRGTLWGIFSWGAQAVGLFLILLGLHVSGNIVTLLLSTLLVFCLSAIIGFASLIPGGIGISEGSMTGLLILFLNLNRSTAVIATLLIRILTLWFGVSLGIIALYKSLKKHD